MFNGLKKAITFSFDDGITQDKRLIEIFDKYGLKCTFNINSGLFGLGEALLRENVTVPLVRLREHEIKEVYKNHEVAVHTLTHPKLTECSDEVIISEVEDDRLKLSNIVGYNVLGMAYPSGKHDERVAEVIKNNTGVKYSRTIDSSYSFDLQDDLIRFNPTVYYIEKAKMIQLADEFLNLQTDTPKLFYIWGHGFELDIDNSWQFFEEFCRKISNKSDIFYGTNAQVFDKYL